MRGRPLAVCLAAFAEAVAEEILQVRNRVDLLDRRLDVVLDAAVSNGIAVEHHIARPPVPVAWLADGADVAQRLAAVEREGGVDVFRAVELEVLGDDARTVR